MFIKHSTQQQNTYSSAQETFTKCTAIFLAIKQIPTGLNELVSYKKCSDHNRIKLEINNRVSGKSPK
jgi:hypothetical protein